MLFTDENNPEPADMSIELNMLLLRKIFKSRFKRGLNTGELCNVKSFPNSIK